MTFTQWINDSSYNVNNYTYNGGTSFNIDHSNEVICVPNGSSYSKANESTVIVADTYYVIDIDGFCKF